MSNKLNFLKLAALILLLPVLLIPGFNIKHLYASGHASARTAETQSSWDIASLEAADNYDSIIKLLNQSSTACEEYKKIFLNKGNNTQKSEEQEILKRIDFLMEKAFKPFVGAGYFLEEYYNHFYDSINTTKFNLILTQSIPKNTLDAKQKGELELVRSQTLESFEKFSILHETFLEKVIKSLRPWKYLKNNHKEIFDHFVTRRTLSLTYELLRELGILNHINNINNARQELSDTVLEYAIKNQLFKPEIIKQIKQGEMYQPFYEISQTSPWSVDGKRHEDCITFGFKYPAKNRQSSSHFLHCCNRPKRGQLVIYRPVYSYSLEKEESFAAFITSYEGLCADRYIVAYPTSRKDSITFIDYSGAEGGYLSRSITIHKDGADQEFFPDGKKDFARINISDLEREATDYLLDYYAYLLSNNSSANQAKAKKIKTLLLESDKIAQLVAEEEKNIQNNVPVQTAQEQEIERQQRERSAKVIADQKAEQAAPAKLSKNQKRNEQKRKTQEAQKKKESALEKEVKRRTAELKSEIKSEWEHILNKKISWKEVMTKLNKIFNEEEHSLVNKRLETSIGGSHATVHGQSSQQTATIVKPHGAAKDNKLYVSKAINFLHEVLDITSTELINAKKENKQN